MTNPQILSFLFLSPVLAMLLWMLVPVKKTWISVVPTLLSLSFLGFLIIQNPEPMALSLGSFLSIPGNVDFTTGFLLNPIRLSLSLLAVFFTLLIQIYSLGYLKKDDPFGLFHFLMSVFQAAMVWLFLANNLFTLFLGWELVGLCSYLLVQFWYEKPDVIRSGIRVMMINKFGDVFLLSGIGLLMSFGLHNVVVNEVNFPPGAEVFLASPTGQVLCLFLVIAAFVKSAQFPFSLWLKEAMSGPTSVSALLHSATMVVAGVWVLTYLSPVFPEPVMWILVAGGGITLLLSNLAAVFSLHLKTTLAFSTLAQLGVMVISIGISQPDQTLLHVGSHAFYKAALFLFCGILMHHAESKGLKGMDSQYIPNLGSAFAKQPVYRWAFVLCCAALAGWPLTSGFISKENLMPDPWTESLKPLEWLAYGILQIGNGLTAFYSMRLALYIGFGKRDSGSALHISPSMGIPVLILSLGAGFWLFGPNPIASTGWLTDYWGTYGKWLHPDVVMVMAGSFFAWMMTWNKDWKVLTIRPFWQRFLLGFSLTEWLGVRLWNSGLQLARLNVKAEDIILEKPLIAGSKIVVVAGYFTTFFDRFFVDGTVISLSQLAKGTGSFLWDHTRRYPQYVVWFAITVLLILIYFSYY